jgi:hypothetical protein
VKKKPLPTTTIDETLLAVAERHADTWRVLLARRGDRATVLAAKEFAATDEAGLAAWLESQRCGDLRVILPAAATIVRSVQMPVAAPMQMLAALRLQAEGMFLGSVPIVRIGLGVLDGRSDGRSDADRQDVVQGLIMAWPEAQVGVAVGPKLEPIARYVPEPAAMLVLAMGGRPAISADRRDGSIAIALQSDAGMVIRATREAAASDIDGDGAWNEGLRRTLVETALNAGIEPARVAAFASDMEASAERVGDRVVMLDQGAIDLLASRLQVQVAAAEDSTEWWRSWSIPLAAVVVSCGPLAELSKMRRFEERAAPSGIERFVELYSQPARALRVACAAFAVMAIAPLGAAWLRGKVLEWKMPEAPSKFELVQRDVEHRIALYSEISKRTLPVTKILGDLACCTPDGIEIESIQLSPTQGVTLRGVAKAVDDKSAAQTVNEMARLLDSSGVFDKTHWRWNQPDGRGIFKFDMDALVVRPTYEFKPDEKLDWSVKTLAQRKYGTAADEDAGSGVGASTASAGATKPSDASESARPTTPPPANATASNGTTTTDGGAAPAGGAPVVAQAGDAGAAAGSAAVPARGIGRRETPATTPPAAEGTPADPAKPATAQSGAGAGGGPAATAAANTAVPEAFTDEQLGAMSKEEARTLLSDISKARRRTDLDADTRKRLSDDFNRILEHLRK